MMQTAYLLPLTVLALVLALAALGFRARRRRGYGPFVVGIVAAFALVGASLWNSWPTKPTTGVPHAPGGTLLQIGGIEKEK